MVVLRLIGTLLAVLTGFVAGMLAAAAVLRDWLPSRGDESSDELTLVAIFDGIELASRSQAFRGGSLLSWFGGIALDLRDAQLAPEARLDVRTVFGGIAVTVPPGWRVEAETTAFAGGVDARVPEPTDPMAPTLSVRAMTIFGGVSVMAHGPRELEAEQPV